MADLRPAVGVYHRGTGPSVGPGCYAPRDAYQPVLDRRPRPPVDADRRRRRGVAAVVDPRRDVDIYLEAARAHDLRISQRRRDPPPQRLRLGRPRARGPDRRDPRHRRRRRAALRAPRPGRRRDVRGRAGCGSPRSTRRATRPSTSRTRSPTRPGPTSRCSCFTGGSLLVGAVGRTDLLGAENARAVRAPACTARSTRSSCPTEDFVAVYPTHGAGSLCSTGIASTPLVDDRLRAAPQPAARADGGRRVRPSCCLAGQPAFPRYFARMRPMNQAGPRLLGGGRAGARRVSAEALEAAVGRGRARRRRPAARGARRRPHPGLALDPARRLVRDVARLGRRPRSADRPRRRATMPTWTSSPARRCASATRRSSATSTAASRRGRRAGRPVEASGRTSLAELAGATGAATRARPRSLIDVRQAVEYEAGHVPGAWHINGGSLPDRLDRAAAGPPDRDDLRRGLPGVDRAPRCCGRPASRTWPGRTRDSPPGARPAIRSNPARANGRGPITPRPRRSRCKPTATDPRFGVRPYHPKMTDGPPSARFPAATIGS